MLAGANLTPDHKGRKLLRKLRWKLERQLCDRQAERGKLFASFESFTLGHPSRTTGSFVYSRNV